MVSRCGSRRPTPTSSQAVKRSGRHSSSRPSMLISASGSILRPTVCGRGMLSRWLKSRPVGGPLPSACRSHSQPHHGSRSIELAFSSREALIRSRACSSAARTSMSSFTYRASTYRSATQTASLPQRKIPRSIAADLGLRCVVVQTNLRSHPAYEPVSWERTHGGALISIAHLLRDVIGRVFISSSAHRSVTRAWGSDRRIDRYWSSTSLTVSHIGDNLWRHEKLERIAHHPLVRRYLRVCWEHLTAEPNCSRCDKCVRTMLTLDRAGALDVSDRFEGGSIAERLDALPIARGPGNRREYMVMLENEADPRIAQALADLLERSPAPSSVEDATAGPEPRTDAS